MHTKKCIVFFSSQVLYSAMLSEYRARLPKKKKKKKAGFVNAPCTWKKLTKALLSVFILTEPNCYQALVTLHVWFYALEVSLKREAYVHYTKTTFTRFLFLGILLYCYRHFLTSAAQMSHTHIYIFVRWVVLRSILQFTKREAKMWKLCICAIFCTEESPLYVPVIFASPCPFFFAGAKLNENFHRNSTEAVARQIWLSLRADPSLTNISRKVLTYIR